MLAKGFGSDRRNRCAKCAGVPRPIYCKKSGGMRGTREPSKKGRLIGQKRPLKSKDEWTIRERLQLEGDKRDLAMFNLAVDSKFRAGTSFHSKSTT